MVSMCVVGTGFMAEEHCRAYGHADGAEITAVVSPNTAEEFVEEQNLDATAYATLDAALDENDIEAVDICSPTPTHREFVEQALAAELPVLCEKPLASSLEEAEAIRDAATDVDVPVMVGHVLRFFPQYAAAKAQVERGRIGNPGVVRARRLSPFPDWADWYSDREASGGLFLDLAVHDFDFLRWTIGDVERVFARRDRGDGFEHGSATLAFENGARGYVEASWAQPESRGLTFEFELAGDEGVLSYDEGEDAPVKLFHDEVSVESPVGTADGYVQEVAHFVECVETGRDPLVGVDEAVESIRIATAANRSAARGEPVTLAEVGR